MHCVLLLWRFCFSLQKIRTVELDGKTIKLQIVSSSSSSSSSTSSVMIVGMFLSYLVGHCWSGEVQDHHL